MQRNKRQLNNISELNGGLKTMPPTPGASRLLWDLPKSSPNHIRGAGRDRCAGHHYKKKNQHGCEKLQSWKIRNIVSLTGFPMRLWRDSLCVKRTSIGKFREWIHCNITNCASFGEWSFKHKRQSVFVPVHWHNSYDNSCLHPSANGWIRLGDHWHLICCGNQKDRTMLLKEYRICMPLTVEEVSSYLLFGHLVDDIL